MLWVKLDNVKDTKLCGNADTVLLNVTESSEMIPLAVGSFSKAFIASSVMK